MVPWLFEEPEQSHPCHKEPTPGPDVSERTLDKTWFQFQGRRMFQNYKLTIACLFTTRPLVFPAWVLLYPARVSLEWCFEYFLTFLHIAPNHLREILRAQSRKENMNLPILHQKARPLDQVFARVCKSLNEVACLTFSSLILFSTKIRPVNIESREETWKNLNRRRISFLQGCSSSCDAWSLARCSRHMNNFCISAPPPHTQTYQAYFQNVDQLSCGGITVT